MNNTEKLLIEILSAFVNERKPKITTEYDAGELYRLAKAQSVSGIVGCVLQKYQFTDLLSAEKRFSLAFDKTVTQFIRREIYAQELLKKLTAAQIPHIIFKGLVIKDCYPVAELRTYGDIDIIIPEEDREKSHKLMCELMYKWEFMDGGDVYSYTKGLEHYEFHTTLNSEKIKHSKHMSNFWNYKKLRDGCTYEFENEFHLCYLISHIEKHVYGSGAGIRMYMDIALFLRKHKNELDLEKVREILRECQLEKFFDSVLFLCTKWFETEVSPSKELSEELYEEFSRFTFRGGVFGMQTKKASMDAEVRQALKANGKTNKLAVIMTHIFPPYREVRRIYPFFNGKPYLLPVGWVVHWFKAAKRSGLKNLKQIASSDVSAAKSEKEFLDQIGSSR